MVILLTSYMEHRASMLGSCSLGLYCPSLIARIRSSATSSYFMLAIGCSSLLLGANERGRASETEHSLRTGPITVRRQNHTTRREEENRS